MDEDKYPSLLDALFSDDTIANIRCGIKWIVWMVGYLLLSLLTIAGMLLLTVVKLLEKYVAPLIPGDRIADGLERFGAYIKRSINSFGEWYEDSVAKTIVEYGAIVLLGAVFIAWLGMIVYFAATAFYTFLTLLGLIAGLFIVAAIAVFGWDWYKNNAADSVAQAVESSKQKAIETPGVRRVYGNCPVSFNQPPKFFEAFIDRLGVDDE